MAFLALIPIAVVATEIVETVAVVGAVATTAYVGIKVVKEVSDVVVSSSRSPPSSSSSSSRGCGTPPQLREKTIFDWWGNGLSHEEYEKLKDLGYPVRDVCFTLEEVKSFICYAKKPGKPTKNDGYDGDGELVKAPNDKNKRGYKDRKGRVWVPTGEGSGDGSSGPHGGAHWDRQYPDGTHDNVYPGGRVRSGTHR